MNILAKANVAQPIAAMSSFPTPHDSIVDRTSLPERASSDFYLSPVIRFDPTSLAIIFEIRDSLSGEITKQFPPEHVVKELRKSAELVQGPFQSAELFQDPFQEVEQTPSDNVVTKQSFIGSRDASSSGEADQDVDVLV